MKIIILTSIALIIGISTTSFKNKESKRKDSIEKAKEDKGIKFFEGTWEEALAKSKKEGKMIFLDCSTSWCYYCKKMDKGVFSKEKVGKFYNENFINVKMDMEKGTGPSLAKKYKISSYPTLLFVNHDGNLAAKTIGYHNQDAFLNLGKKAIELQKK